MTMTFTTAMHNGDEDLHDKKPTNIDSILFNNDDGLVTSLLQDKMNITTTITKHLEGSNENIHPTRIVRFCDTDVSEEEKRSLSDNSMESDLIQVLKDRLAEVQSDLKTERAIRIRKEKNLVKLAKELNRRTTEAHEKEEKIEDMAGRMNAMETILKSNQNDLSRQVLSYKDVSLQKELKIAELDDSLLFLRMKLAQANTEANQLRQKLNGEMTTSSDICADVAVSKTVRSNPLRMLLVCLSVLIVACAACSTVLAHLSGESLHRICSPVMPGSVLYPTNDSGTMISPWWAHQSFKHQAFDLICGSNPRMQISWKGEKVFVHSLANDGRPASSILQHSAPLGVKVGASEIIIFTKNGLKAVKAPWAK